MEKLYRDLWNPTDHSVFMRQAALWTLIPYSIPNKAALNLLIYLRAPPDRHSLCVTDALSDTFAARRQLVGAVVVLR